MCRATYPEDPPHTLDSRQEVNDLPDISMKEKCLHTPGHSNSKSEIQSVAFGYLQANHGLKSHLTQMPGKMQRQLGKLGRNHRGF